MLEELVVKNFKSLIDVDLKLGKLNLFIGPNNSGKSSILQVLVLLKQFELVAGIFMKNPYQGKFFYFENYKETVSHKNESVRIGIRITKRLSEQEVESLKTTVSNQVHSHPSFPKFYEESSSLSYDLRIGPNGLEAQAIRLNDECIYDGSIDHPKEMNSLRVFSSDQYRYTGFRPPDNLFGPSWEGKGGSDVYSLADFFKEAGNIISRWVKNIQFLPVTRGIVDWKYPIAKIRPEGHIPKDKGHSAANILFFLGKEDYSPIREKVINWTKIFGLENVGSRVEEYQHCTVEARDSELEVAVNIAGAGFGVGQILPVIIECFRTPKNTTILIEEPEIHLHPALQVELPDFFLEVIGEGKQLFVTTHSEHLLVRLQTRIVEGTINPEDVRIYYVTKDKNGTHAEPVKIDENGVIIGGLPEFFETDEKELRSWLEAIKKSKERSE